MRGVKNDGEGKEAETGDADNEAEETKQANCEAVAIIADNFRRTIEAVKCLEVRMKKVEEETSMVLKQLGSEAAGLRKHASALQGELCTAQTCMEKDNRYDVGRVTALPQSQSPPPPAS